MPTKMKPTSEIILRLGLNSNGPVENFFVSTCARHMDKYVPYKEGNLSSYYIIGNKIVYDQEYAKYQYYGMRRDGSRVINPDNRDRSKHPLATSYWDKKMVTAEMQDVEKEVQDFIKHGGK